MATNSIIIANLPDWTSTTPPKHHSSGDVTSSSSDPVAVLPSAFLESLRAVIQVHRDIVHWVPVRSFRRIFCTFINSEDAELVRCALNGCIFEGHRLDVYFGEETPLILEKKYLEPPVLEKNWLISPPGSPQEGWVQIEEDRPNSVTLHEDIQAALDRLADDLLQQENEAEEEEEGSIKGKVILDTTRLGGVQVVVHNWDEEENSDGEFGYGGRGINGVKATVESLGKTPRPPI